MKIEIEQVVKWDYNSGGEHGKRYRLEAKVAGVLYVETVFIPAYNLSRWGESDARRLLADMVRKAVLKHAGSVFLVSEG